MVDGPDQASDERSRWIPGTTQPGHLAIGRMRIPGFLLPQSLPLAPRATRGMTNAQALGMIRMHIPDDRRRW